MRKVTVMAGVVALLGMTGIASADGMPSRYKAAPAYHGFSWSGVYFGSHVGWGWADADLTDNLIVSPQPPPFPLRSSHDADGWLAGVHLGAMKQFGAIVVGVELSLDGANINGSGGNCLGISTLAPGVASNCEADVKWMSTALSRLGFAFDRFLVYGTAGWAVAGVDHRLTLSAGGAAITTRQSDVADGLALGAGFEWAVARDFTLGLQYLHVNLDSKGEGLFPGGITHGQRDLDVDVVTARLSYKFGGDCCAGPLK